MTPNMIMKKRVAKILRDASIALIAYDKAEFMRLKDEISHLKKQVGLKDYYRYLNISISFMSHPELVVFGGVSWSSSDMTDYSNAQQFGEDITDVSQKVKKVLDLFKKNHPEAKIVKYPR